MKTLSSKHLAVVLLSLGIAAGCASTPKEPEQTGPTQAEMEAQRAAEQAAKENQAMLEKAQALLDEVNNYAHLNADQESRKEEGRQAIADQDGQKAYDTLSALLSELKSASMTYNVVRGDNLWDISGKSDVYGNPYEWPLIYKNNSDKIKDADLIFPGQQLDVKSNPLKSDVDSAIQHAKNRGAWSVGKVESSDQDYLAQ